MDQLQKKYFKSHNTLKIMTAKTNHSICDFPYQTVKEIDSKLNYFQQEFNKNIALDLEENQKISNSQQRFLVRRESDVLENQMAQALVGNIVDSALVKAYMQIKKKNVSTEGLICNKILSKFGINEFQIKLIKDPIEQQQTIVNQLLKMVDDLIRKWSKDFRKNPKYQQYNKKDQQKQKIDINDWLDIKTNHEAIKAKLKQIIIENISEYENQIEAARVLVQREQIQNSNNKNQKVDDIKLKLQNYQKFSTNQVLINSQQENQYKKISDLNAQNTFWDNNKENIYQTIKQQTVQIFKNENQNGNYTKIVFNNMQGQVGEIEKKQQSIETLMQSFFNGEILLAEDLQFLLKSNNLLNSCINQKYYSNLVNMLERDTIQEMELALSENIIKRHFQIQSLVKQLRTDYFKQKIQENKKKWIKCETTRNATINRQERFKHFQNKKSTYSTIGKINDQKIKNEKQKTYDYLKTISFKKNPNDNQDIKQKVVEYMEHNQQRKEQQKLQAQHLKEQFVKPKRQYLNVTQQDLFTKSCTPQSKIMIYQNLKQKPNQNIDQTLNQQRIQIKLKNQERYRNYIKQHLLLKNRKNFQNSISGGPLKTFTRDGIDDNEIEKYFLKQILLIQRYVRGYHLRKLLKKELEQKKQDEINKNIRIAEKMMKKHFEQTQNDYPNQYPAKLSISIDQQSTSCSKRPKTARNRQMPTIDFRDLQETPQHCINQQLFSKHLKLLACAQKMAFQQLQKYNFLFYPQDLNILDSSHMSPLAYCVKNGDIQFATYLLKLKADPNFKCQDGNTSLHFAFKQKNYEMIVLLADYKGDLNSQNDQMQTPLFFGDRKLLQILNLSCGIAHHEKDRNQSKDNNRNFKGLLINDLDLELEQNNRQKHYKLETQEKSKDKKIQFE